MLNTPKLALTVILSLLVKGIHQMRISPLLIALCCASVLPASAARKATEPPVLVKKVLPPQPVASPGVLIEPTRVEMVVDPEGRPFALEASIGLSDAMVTALSKWRFKPGLQNNRRVAYAMAFLIPVAWALTPERERALAQTWVQSGLLIRAFDLARTWDVRKIEKLKKGLRIKSQRADIAHGVPLLHALLSGSPQEIQQAREDHLLWMVKNAPEADILGTPAALVGKSGEPFGDSELRQQIAREWLKQVSASPANFDVLDHALNFLQFGDPRQAAVLAASTRGWPKAALWLGHEYGLRGLGVTGLNPASGQPTVPDGRIPSTPSAVDARLTLLNGQNTKVVLAGLAAVIGTKQVLARSGDVPAGLDEFCSKLLQHARQLYPKTSLSCDLAIPLFYSDPFRTSPATGVVTAKLIRKVPPRYPTDARYRRIQGTVKLSAFIDRQGHVKDLEFLSGPLVFYRATVDAVKHWEYRPTSVKGKPIEVQTTVTVNYEMRE
ncbi:MAG TPA: energy transducer TonB [Bryobacteraceae bacterium]